MTGQNDRILIVDDNRMNRVKLSYSLAQQGYSAKEAENGRQALEMIEAGEFDLVLLDIVMPEMDGFQVLEQLKAHPAWRDIPVIIISALDDMDNTVKGIAMGAEDYLPKPFDAVLLKARIGACLEKKRLRNQEVEYLHNVALVTEAAAAVEAETFDPDSLSSVAARQDKLGQLARVFQRMAREVYAREQRLKLQVEQLKIELDETKRSRQVAEITESEYFQRLESQIEEIRNARKRRKTGS